MIHSSNLIYILLLINFSALATDSNWDVFKSGNIFANECWRNYSITSEHINEKFFYCKNTQQRLPNNEVYYFCYIHSSPLKTDFDGLVCDHHTNGNLQEVEIYFDLPPLYGTYSVGIITFYNNDVSALDFAVIDTRPPPLTHIHNQHQINFIPSERKLITSGTIFPYEAYRYYDGIASNEESSNNESIDKNNFNNSPLLKILIMRSDIYATVTKLNKPLVGNIIHTSDHLLLLALASSTFKDTSVTFQIDYLVQYHHNINKLQHIQSKLQNYLTLLTFLEGLKVNLSILRQFEYSNWIPNLLILKSMQLKELKNNLQNKEKINEKFNHAWILIKYFASFDVVIYQCTDWTNAADPAIIGNFLYLSKEYRKIKLTSLSSGTSTSTTSSEKNDNNSNDSDSRNDDSLPKIIRYVTANDRLHPFRIFPADAYVSDSAVYAHECWWAVMSGTY